MTSLVSVTSAPQPENDLPRIVPCVELFAAPVLVSRTEGFRDIDEETVLPLLKLSFDYDGTRVRAGDERTRLFRSSQSGILPVLRNVPAETAARRLLERFGAVELGCMDELAPPPDCDADYVLRPHAGAHALCAFTTEALPQLRAHGWNVQVADDYPFQVAGAETPWFARVEPDADLPDWFSVELGVEVDGARVDLLPLVVDLLEHAGESDDLRALERRFRSTFALRVNETHHVTVGTDTLRALLRVVIELYQGVKKRTAKIVFPRSAPLPSRALAKVFETRGTALSWNDPAKVATRGARVLATPTPVVQSPELRATLRPYQDEGVAFLQHLRREGVGGILADDMGLGKTLQTIAHLVLEKDAGRLDKPALVVAPTSLAFNWSRELEKFAPHLRVTVLHGPGRRALYAEASARRRRRHDLPDAGAATRSSSRSSRSHGRSSTRRRPSRTRAPRPSARSRRSAPSIASALTGTPVENHLGELWALFDFLNPGLLGDELDFRRFYRQPIEARNDETRLDALREQVAPYILRRHKRDVAKDLPPKTEVMRGVELRGAQRELYEHIRVAAHADVRKVIRQKGLAASTIPILDALMKLRQVCCDPRLVRMDAAGA